MAACSGFSGRRSVRQLRLGDEWRDTNEAKLVKIAFSPEQTLQGTHMQLSREGQMAVEKSMEWSWEGQTDLEKKS